jgi:hypothetical protein
LPPSSRPRSKPSKIASRQQAVQAHCFLVAVLAYPSAPEEEGNMLLRVCGKLHGVTFQKMVLLVVIAIRATNISALNSVVM